jgi:hypothetical protein
VHRHAGTAAGEAAPAGPSDTRICNTQAKRALLPWEKGIQHAVPLRPLVTKELPWEFLCHELLLGGSGHRRVQGSRSTEQPPQMAPLRPWM